MNHVVYCIEGEVQPVQDFSLMTKMTKCCKRILGLMPFGMPKEIDSVHAPWTYPCPSLCPFLSAFSTEVSMVYDGDFVFSCTNFTEGGSQQMAVIRNLHMKTQRHYHRNYYKYAYSNQFYLLKTPLCNHYFFKAGLSLLLGLLHHFWDR